MSSARTQLELIALLPVFYGNGLATCCPCPLELFVEIIRINHLRAQFHALESASREGEGKSAGLNTGRGATQEDRTKSMLDILRRVKMFKAGDWAGEVVMRPAAADCMRKDRSYGLVGEGNGAKEVNIETGMKGWLCLAKIYQAAVALYCMASLRGFEGHYQETVETAQGMVTDDTRVMTPTLETSSLSKAKEGCLAKLLHHLQEMRSHKQLRKMVLWPLVMAGIQAHEKTERRCVADELTWVSSALGTTAPLVARRLLETRVWGMGVAGWKWDEMFDQEYVFAV